MSIHHVFPSMIGYGDNNFYKAKWQIFVQDNEVVADI